MILEGASNNEIAKELGLSVRTIEAHLNHLALKTGLKGLIPFRLTLYKEYFYALGYRDGIEYQGISNE
jgi:hypothetical protein